MFITLLSSTDIDKKKQFPRVPKRQRAQAYENKATLDQLILNKCKDCWNQFCWRSNWLWWSGNPCVLIKHPDVPMENYQVIFFCWTGWGWVGLDSWRIKITIYQVHLKEHDLKSDSVDDSGAWLNFPSTLNTIEKGSELNKVSIAIQNLNLIHLHLQIRVCEHFHEEIFKLFYFGNGDMTQHTKYICRIFFSLEKLQPLSPLCQFWKEKQGPRRSSLVKKNYLVFNSFDKYFWKSSLGKNIWFPILLRRFLKIMLWNKDYRVATIFKYCELFSGKKQVICFEKFTFIIVSFLLAINSFVVKIISNFFLAIEIAFIYIVLDIAIAITYFLVKITFAIEFWEWRTLKVLKSFLKTGLGQIQNDVFLNFHLWHRHFCPCHQLFGPQDRHRNQLSCPLQRHHLF